LASSATLLVEYINFSIMVLENHSGGDASMIGEREAEDQLRCLIVDYPSNKPLEWTGNQRIRA
jgi:hypothetical protein